MTTFKLRIITANPQNCSNGMNICIFLHITWYYIDVVEKGVTFLVHLVDYSTVHCKELKFL